MDGTRRAWAAMAAAGMLWTAAGCASTATVQTWRPAEIDVAGMNRVAVLDFQGTMGEATSAAVAARLWRSDFFTLVDRSELESAAGRRLPPGDTAAALQAARAAGVEGLILGEMSAYRCDDHVTEDSHLSLINAKESDGKKKTQSSSSGLSVETNVTMTREAVVSFTFRLLDVRTGQVRASRPVTHSFSGQSVNGETPLPPADAALAQLMDACTQDVAVMLAPHVTEHQVTLASAGWFGKGAPLVRQGVKAAKKGEWDRAAAAWESALQAEPNNHAAMFNLALAREAKHDYTAAEDLINQAVKINPNTNYSDSLARVREEKTNYLLAQQQRDARTLPSDPRSQLLPASFQGPPGPSAHEALGPER